MSASFAAPSNETYQSGAFNNVTSLRGETTTKQSANGTESSSNDHKEFSLEGTVGRADELVREESSIVTMAQGATNELKNQTFVKAWSEASSGGNRLREVAGGLRGKPDEQYEAEKDPLKRDASRASSSHEEWSQAEGGKVEDLGGQAERILEDSPDGASNSTSNKLIEYDDNDDDNSDDQANHTSTSGGVHNQLLELESLVTPESNLDLNRRAGQQGSLLAALGSPLTSELRRLRQSGVKKVQRALRHKRRRRRQRNPSAQHKKRETTSLPIALIKSMQTRQGLISGVGGGPFQSSGATTSQQQPASPLIKQLAAANPLKQQLASGSMQISTAIQRLLGLSNLPGAAHNQSQATRMANKLMLHNNNHLLSSLDEDQTGGGGDYSATSATSASEQLNNLLAASQQDATNSLHVVGQPMGGHTSNQHEDFLTDMQSHHRPQQPLSPSLGAFEDDAAPALHRGHSLADYQSSASTQGDRLAELIGQWNGRQQQQQREPDSPINAGHQQEDALKLSQLVAAAAAARGQSTPPAATNKQLIPIEIIGLDPSVTNSILYGQVGRQQQQQQPQQPQQHLLRPMKQSEALDETPAGYAAGPTAATELDVQENPQSFQVPASLRNQRHPIDQAPAYAEYSQTSASSGADSGSSGDKPSDGTQAVSDKAIQGPSSVLHIHHFHHTQPSAGAVAEQQPSASSGPASGESVEQPESGAEQQSSGESGKEAEGSQAGEELEDQRPTASPSSKGHKSSEAPRLVLMSGAGSGVGSKQENNQEEPKQVFAWSSEVADNQNQAGNNIESGLNQEEDSESSKGANALGPLHAKRMRFVTRNSLHQRHQPVGYQNLTYASGHSHDGSYSPSSQSNIDQQQIIVNKQNYQLQRPILSRPHSIRRPDGYSALPTRHYQAPLNNLLKSVSEQTDPQQALSDSPESQGMLMVSYRPTGTVVPTANEGQMLPPFYEHIPYNRSFIEPTYTRQTPYNEGSESKTPSQLLFQRPIYNSTQSLVRPSMSNYASSSSMRVPSPNLLKNLIKHPKMNEALLMQQLHASNQSTSPYWSNEDERLLAQFNLASAPGQLKIAPANLLQNANSSLDGYSKQLFDNMLLMSRLNHTIGSPQQLVQQVRLPLGVEHNNSSQRLTSDELSQVMREQASRQLQYQNQIKQQQQAQVASLLLNNLAGANIGGFNGSSSPSDESGVLQANGGKNSRFELTMASDRSPSKLPVLRNAANNNVRMTKHFHVPDTGLHDKEASKAVEGNMENHTKVPLSGIPLDHPVHVQASAPKHTSHQVVVENILDSAHGLGNLALGFIFLVLLMSFILILASLVYRRRRAIGSAQCGPSTMHRDDDADSSSQPKSGALESSGRKSLRCLNNITQRTKHLMRTNFSGANSTSNVIAGSTPLSSLKSLNQLDSSITSDLQNHHGQAHDHRTSTNKTMQISSPQVGRKTSQLLEPIKNNRHGWESQEARSSGLARPSKYSCPNQAGSIGQAKLSTFNVSGRLINGQHHSGLDKYSTPDESDPCDGNVGIRTLNTRFHKNAYIQKTLAASSSKQNHEHIRSSISGKLGLPPDQPARPLAKKHQQYNRASPASIEMPQSQAKYVNTQVQLKNANL